MSFLYIYPPTAVSVTVPPIECIKDGINTQVEQDTANPSNNNFFPSMVGFIKDGVTVAVLEDTVTPANNEPLPVKLTGVTGDVIINAGDLNVSTSSVNDSMAIGDGITGNLVEVSLNNDATTYSLKVKDDDANTALDAIKTSSELIDDTIAIDGGSALTKFQTVGGHTGSTSHAWHVDNSGLGRIDVRASVLPTGASTLAEQQAQTVHLGQIESAVELIDDTVNTDANPAGTKGLLVGGIDGSGDFQRVSVNTAGELSVTFGSAGFATETTLSALNNKHNADFGASAGGIRTAAQIGNATGAADFNAGADSAQTLRVSANLKRAGNELSYNAGTVDANTLRVIPASDYVPNAAAALSGSYQEIINLTNVAQTFTAPANAKWCKIQADDQNSTTIRVKIGAAATVSSGLQFQPGRSEDYQIAGNVSVIAETAVSNQKIYVQFGV